MKQADRWDAIYADQHTCPTNACEVLIQNQHLLPAHGVALDYASGLGANALLLARNQLTTHAWDISSVALSKLTQFALEGDLDISTQVRDIERHPPEPESFDVIVVSNFLHRPTFQALIDALKSNGVLYYQTFIQEKVMQVGPSNPDFLLRSNELLTLCSSLHVLVYREEGLQGDDQRGWRNQAMVVAKKLIR